VHAEDVAFEAVAEARPKLVLDAGCGTGEFAERVQREIPADVQAVDLSPRMVALTAARGVRAQPADIQALPFADASFDVVVANWVLHHLESVERGVSELARVLRPRGRLVAGTQGRGHFLNVWEFLGDPWQPKLAFDDVTGVDALAGHFASVELRRGDGAMVFPDAGALREYVSVTITHAHLATRVPERLDGPFKAEVRNAVFVAHAAA
jgi:SAM-dependent methyltransferase